MVRRIRVVPQNSDWTKRFIVEADQLAIVLGDEVVAIHHIGSTAIPNTWAKPIIDILVEVHDIERIDEFNEAMLQQGYKPRGEFGIPGRRYFRKGSDEARTHHVHAFQTGHPEVRRHLNFRDYLISHPEEAQAYGRLKGILARQFPEVIDTYTEGKSGFIEEMDRRARAWRETSDQ